jgi:hypothetical protein
MNDQEDVRVTPRDHAGAEHYGETLLYDFAKFLTTLSLLVLGGMLTLSGTADAGDLKFFNIVFVSASVAFAGMLAFTIANSVVSARAIGKEPPAYLTKVLKGAMGLIGMGLGGFLMMWLDVLA